MNLSKSTIALLTCIENEIDEETEQDFIQEWQNFLDHNQKSQIFSAKRKKVSFLDWKYKDININDAVNDYEQMLFSQLEGVLKALHTENKILSVRANYGTGILPSLFGAKLFMMPYQMNTLPAVKPLELDQIKNILESGVPDLWNGLGKKVFEMGEIYAEVFSKYPKIEKYVSVYHPDAQGPLDVCELIFGSELFYMLYDEPELIKQMLQLICETYIAFMEKWYSIFPRNAKRNVHWDAIMHKGTIVIRNDSAMNLSPEMYKEFAMPYDAMLLDYFDGGIIHFCGRGDHYIEIMSRIPKLYGINMSQPDLNDMEKIYKNTVDKGIQILGFDPLTAQKHKNRAGGFHYNLSV